LHHMMAGAHRMRALVRDLQVYLAAAETAAPLTLQRVRTMACLERVRRDLGEAIRHSAAHIEAESLPVVSGDPVLLATLFRCLIDNALKHRPPEVTPRIILSARREDGQWVFSVKDNGSGIDPRYIPRLFRVFEQLRASDGEDATGIGLAMARIIVERHGGRIWVDSAGEGHGSTFHFTLPEDTAAMSGSPTVPAGQAG
ncbi:MAG: hypothetical protein K2Q10_06535, partial [Rhodospirillales bacterium]|nr:hypothetical protein [Rhodospirillales bacterium]